MASSSGDDAYDVQRRSLNKPRPFCHSEARFLYEESAFLIFYIFAYNC
jgi:hypothetical protein